MFFLIFFVLKKEKKGKVLIESIKKKHLAVAFTYLVFVLTLCINLGLFAYFYLSLKVCSEMINWKMIYKLSTLDFVLYIFVILVFLVFILFYSYVTNWMFKVYRTLANSSRLYMLFEMVVIASKLSLIYRLWLKKTNFECFLI